VNLGSLEFFPFSPVLPSESLPFYPREKPYQHLKKAP
jgi:hypothetical protein